MWCVYVTAGIWEWAPRVKKCNAFLFPGLYDLLEVTIAWLDSPSCLFGCNTYSFQCMFLVWMLLGNAICIQHQNIQPVKQQQRGLGSSIFITVMWCVSIQPFSRWTVTASKISFSSGTLISCQATSTWNMLVLVYQATQKRCMLSFRVYCAHSPTVSTLAQRLQYLVLYCFRPAVATVQLYILYTHIQACCCNSAAVHSIYTRSVKNLFQLMP